MDLTEIQKYIGTTVHYYVHPEDNLPCPATIVQVNETTANLNVFSWNQMFCVDAEFWHESFGEKPKGSYFVLLFWQSGDHEKNVFRPLLQWFLLNHNKKQEKGHHGHESHSIYDYFRRDLDLTDAQTLKDLYFVSYIEVPAEGLALTILPPDVLSQKTLFIPENYTLALLASTPYVKETQQGLYSDVMMGRDRVKDFDLVSYVMPAHTGMWTSTKKFISENYYIAIYRPKTS